MNDEKKRIKAEDIYLCHIFRLMKSLTRRFRRIDYESDKPDDNEKFETNGAFAEPYQDLLIWALLNCRIETAEYFWELCADPLITAVAATLICDRLADRVDNISSDVSKRYKLAKE
uniref:TRPM-like domain-containing protein n=1 Tax=Romanomermis culicivorax TaxID=13658 RepID=A0A915J5Y6_ROMCU